MPVDTPHPEHTARADHWRRIRDAVAGWRAVSAAGETYLRKLDHMDALAYEIFHAGAKWYAASAQTINMMVGMVERKPPVTMLSPALEAVASDITGGGVSLDAFASDVIADVLAIGRTVVVVDYDGDRPRLVRYRGEDLINWRVERVAGADVLTMAVLRESTYEPAPSDPFTLAPVERYRVLHLDEDRRCVTQVYERSATGEWLPAGDPQMPRIRGQRIGFVPVLVAAARVQPPDVVGESPIDGIVGLCYRRYLLSATHAYGLHWVALPTPFVAGFTADDGADAPTTIGPSKLWMLPPGATAGYLSYSGSGLAEIRAAMDEDKAEIADMGARLLETRSRSAEAARTVDLKQTSDASVLSGVVMSVSETITRALRMADLWAGGAGGDDITYQANSDFIPEDMDPAMLRELVGAVQAGEISRAEFFALLQAGGLVPATKQFDEHAAEIDEDQALRGAPMPMPQPAA